MIPIFLIGIRGIIDVTVYPGYPQTLRVPVDGVKIKPSTSSIFYFPDTSMIDITEQHFYLAPPNTIEIYPTQDHDVDIVFGVLNTPSGSCQWEVITGPYFELTQDKMENDRLYCIAFFSEEPKLTKFIIQTIDTEADDHVHIYDYNNHHLYTMAPYDQYTIDCTAFAMFYRTDLSVVEGSIVVYDYNRFLSPGSFNPEIKAKDEFNILPKHYIVIHNPSYFNVFVREDVTKFGTGIYYSEHIYTLRVQAIGQPHNISFQVFVQPNVKCDQVYVYNGYNGNFAVDASINDHKCFLLSSPYYVDYPVYTTNYGGTVQLFKKNGNYIADLSGDYWFTYRDDSVFIHVMIGTSQGGVVTCDKTPVLSPMTPNEVFADEWSSNFKSQPIVPFKGTARRFRTGFYRYYIPEAGSTLTFSRHTIYVFHNPQNFTAVGTNLNFLAEGDYVLNVTDVGFDAFIKPKPGFSDRILNISVLNYKRINLFDNCNSVDVVTLAPSFANGFVASYSKIFGGFPANISVEAEQRVCLWYVASSPFTLTAYKSDTIPEDSGFAFMFEKLGAFTAPDYMNSIRSRSVLSIFRTTPDIGTYDIGGATVSVSKMSNSFTERAGLLRGTRSYMDFQFAQYTTSTDSLLNVGTREPELKSKAHNDHSSKLTTLHIVLISLGCVFCVVVVCIVAFMRSKTAVVIRERRANEEDFEHSESSDDRNMNYMSSSPSSIPSAYTTTSSSNHSPNSL